MTPELRQAIKRHEMWFGSYKVSGELKKIQVWLTLNAGLIEFLTDSNSYKAKRARRNPRVICFIGRENGPAVPGTAEVVNDNSAITRVYRAYWNAHPIAMLWISFFIRSRIRSGRQVAIVVRPDDPNPLVGA